MIWDSIPMMTAIDLVIIAFAVTAIAQLVRERRRLARNRVVLGPAILVLGLAIVGGFYLVDLLAMFAPSGLLDDQVRMTLMEDLHLEYSWVVMVVAVGALAVGFTMTSGGLLDLVRRVESTEGRLRQELEARRETERALRASESRLAGALQAGAVGTWAWDIQSGEVSWSDQVETIFGLSPGTFGGTYDDYVSLIHPDDREAVESTIRATLRGKRDYAVEHRVRGGDGSERWIEGRGQVFRDETGQPVRMAGTVSDVTPRKESEASRLTLDDRIRQLQRLESMSVMAGGVAHDFNNIFVGMLGHADLALLDLPPESAIRLHVEGFRKAALRASELTGQLLAYSGKGRFVVEPMDVGAIASDMRTLLESTVSKKAVLVLDAPESLPVVEGDAAQVRQLILNLVTNASEALGDNEGTIRIRTGMRDVDQSFLDDGVMSQELAEGRYVFLEVTDDGEGIAPEVQERMFDPFFSTRFVGRGLGLAAVEGIARAHRGFIRVTSAPGAGTTIRVYLPVLDDVGTPEEAAHDVTLQEPGGAGRRLVLVADDEEPIRAIAKAVLERAGFQVVSAANGREAVARFREHAARISAILLDATMPVMSGAEALAEIRTVDPDVPVVFTSGYTEGHAAHALGDRNDVRFLQKPFRPNALVAEIQAVVREAV